MKKNGLLIAVLAAAGAAAFYFFVYRKKTPGVRPASSGGTGVAGASLVPRTTSATAPKSSNQLAQQGISLGTNLLSSALKGLLGGGGGGGGRSGAGFSGGGFSSPSTSSGSSGFGRSSTVFGPGYSGTTTTTDGATLVQVNGDITDLFTDTSAAPSSVDLTSTASSDTGAAYDYGGELTVTSEPTTNDFGGELTSNDVPPSDSGGSDSGDNIDLGDS